jgi:hypothetical protein
MEWRSRVKTDPDFAALIRAAYKLGPATVSADQALERAHAYHGDFVIAAETEHENAFRERLAKFRANFLAGPLLILPVGKTFKYGFDPYQVVHLDDSNTIYLSSHVTADWGTLDAPGGVLIVHKDGLNVRLQVPAPHNLSAQPLRGEGWTLVLQKGWVLVPGERAGDYVLKPENRPH